MWQLSGMQCLYHSLGAFLAGIHPVVYLQPLKKHVSLHCIALHCIAVLSFKLRRECIPYLVSIVLSCWTWNALDQTRYYAQAMPKWSKLFAISLFLQCTIAPSLPAMSLSVRNLPVSCLTSFHCVCSPFLAISRNACWGSNITQIQLYLWQFDFWKRIYSCWFGDHCIVSA